MRRRRFVALTSVAVVALVAWLASGGGRPSVPAWRQRIVAAAESQVGYRTDPPDTYCNKFSAFWGSGPADCGNRNRDEQWCADFAAWAWRQADVPFRYGEGAGEINSAAISFYEWGVDHHRWHPVGSGYRPRPGDVAVYGLNLAADTAAHVAVVTGDRSGDKGPDVVNGDGDRTGFSVVETGTDQYYADAGAHTAPLAGYVVPLPPYTVRSP